jgi:hypothetical protein
LTPIFKTMNPLIAPFAPPQPGSYPWDQWKCHALESSLAPELATLGRAVMREADQHSWCDRLKTECGLSDDGRAMLARVLDRPERTAARWQWLLVTDGLRFDPWEQNHFREDSPCWKGKREKWNREQAREARN